MKFTPLAIAITALLINSVNADEVDDSVVTTFSAGTPAVATEVNTNFAELIRAINDNAARIAAFEELSNPVVDADDLDGSRYCFNMFEAGVGAQDVLGSIEEGFFGWRTASTGTQTGKIEFLSNTQGDITVTQSQFYDLSHPLREDSFIDDPESFMFSYSAPYVTMIFTDDDGSTETVTATLSPDGNTLILQFNDVERSDDDTGNFGFAGMLIGVRADNCEAPAQDITE